MHGEKRRPPSIVEECPICQPALKTVWTSSDDEGNQTPPQNACPPGCGGAAGDGRDLAATDVDQFCATNAVHTAWPFWREFITSSLLRSGLESVPVPPFTVYGPQKAAVTYQRDEENPAG